MHKITLALAIIVIGLASATGAMWLHTRSLSAALELWHNCPLPTKGAVLIVEADWPGQTSADEYRCSIARKSPARFPPRATY